MDPVAEHESDVRGRLAPQLRKEGWHPCFSESSPTLGLPSWRQMKSPKQIKVEQRRDSSSYPYRYSDRGRPILNLLAGDDDDLLSDLTELEGATNDRLLGESGRLPGISAIELVSGFRPGAYS